MFLVRLLTLMAGKDTKIYTSATISRVGVSLILPGVLVLMTLASGPALPEESLEGKALVMQRSKGNCLACHAIADGELPGNLGPPLVGMKARFPDADVLREQIWDAAVRNPETRMPPFGRHGILSRNEIDLIVQYLYTL